MSFSLFTPSCALYLFYGPAAYPLAIELCSQILYQVFMIALNVEHLKGSGFISPFIIFYFIFSFLSLKILPLNPRG
jgi:hypothetical protein